MEGVFVEVKKQNSRGRKRNPPTLTLSPRRNTFTINTSAVDRYFSGVTHVRVFVNSATQQIAFQPVDSEGAENVFRLNWVAAPKEGSTPTATFTSKQTTALLNLDESRGTFRAPLREYRGSEGEWYVMADVGEALKEMKDDE